MFITSICALCVSVLCFVPWEMIAKRSLPPVIPQPNTEWVNVEPEIEPIIIPEIGEALVWAEDRLGALAALTESCDAAGCKGAASRLRQAAATLTSEDLVEYYEEIKNET